MKILADPNVHVQIKQQEFDALALQPHRPGRILQRKGDGNPAKTR